MGSSVSRPRRRVVSSRKFKTVAIIGAPLGEGQDHATGVERGPSEIRAGGLAPLITNLAYIVEDLGDISTVSSSVPTLIDGVKNAESIGASLTALYNRIIGVSVDKFVLTLGGDHSVGSATILANLRRFPDLRVLWVDAHGDCNTPEISDSHNYHGMSAAHALGWFGGKTGRVAGFEFVNETTNFLREERLVYVGLRDLDEKEKELLRRSKCVYYTMEDVDRFGIAEVMEMAVKHLQANKHPVHLTLDIDGIDPAYAPGTGTLARGGLTYREAHYLCERIHATGNLVSMDMVEVNPTLDEEFLGNSPLVAKMHGDMKGVQTNLPTVKLALELIASALGKTII